MSRVQRCGVHTQAGCGWISLPAEFRFSNRPKNIRQTSPSRGGSDRLFASAAIPLHGIASSTVQPRSTTELSLMRPSTWTADRRPGRSQSRNAHLAPRGCVPRQNVSASRSSFPANGSTFRRARFHSRLSNLPNESFQMKKTSYMVPSALISNS